MTADSEDMLAPPGSGPSRWACTERTYSPIPLVSTRPLAHILDYSRSFVRRPEGHSFPLSRIPDGSLRRAVRDARQITAEQIQHSFPSLTLRDVYGAIFYYLDHAQEVETYLADQEGQAEEIERTVRSTQGPTCLQKRLEERRARLLK